MQGINTVRHRRMNDALLQLQEIMNECGYLDDSNEMRLKRKELETSYIIYIELLQKLSIHILEYEELYNDIKMRTLGRKLARIKRIMKPTSHNFVQLRDTITNRYGA